MVAALRRATAHGPLFVGVFANQSPAEVKRISEEVGLDIIQLSGHEGWNDLSFYEPFAVINAEHVSNDSSVESLFAKVKYQTFYTHTHTHTHTFVHIKNRRCFI
jgi:phosphoribosylanthranilate isomerase